MVAQMRSILGQHQAGIGIGGTHPQVSDSLIPLTADATILRSQLLDPLMTLAILLGEFLIQFLRE